MPIRDASIDDLDLRLPMDGDRAFVSTHPLRGATVAEDVGERLWRMVKGYRQAADLLVEEAERIPHERRNLIYPIVFCYRHFLEIVLKQFLEDYGHFVGEKPEFRQHGLEAIWRKCRKVIEHFNPGSDAATLESVAELIREFSKADPASYAFRYATSTAGKRLELGIESFNLPMLRESMAGIYNFFECLDLHIQSLDYR